MKEYCGYLSAHTMGLEILFVPMQFHVMRFSWNLDSNSGLNLSLKSVRWRLNNKRANLNIEFVNTGDLLNSEQTAHSEYISRLPLGCRKRCPLIYRQ